MVGTAGFEPATTTPPVWCATRLRYAPKVAKYTGIPDDRESSIGDMQYSADDSRLVNTRVNISYG